MKRSPFYELHVKAGAKMASRAWATPIEYVGVKEEHEAVRQRAGIIDFSSMGEISIKGKEKRFTAICNPSDMEQIVYNMLHIG